MKERLHDTLDEERDSSRLLVLCGLGGAGKSSLALTYLSSYRKDYSAVFWLHAVSEASLQKECEQIHDLLYDIAQPRSTKSIEDIKQWFQGRKSRYLWILDNADNVNVVGATDDVDLERYLPDASCVDIIVTTRNQSVQHMSSLPAIQVTELDHIEERDLFIRRAGMSNPTPQAMEDIDRIVEHLGHLALAVKLAGAYVASNPHTKARLGEYLRQLRVDESGFLDQRPQRHVDRYEQSIRRSWELSCEAIAAKCPAALNLLSFLAFMNPVRINPGKFERNDSGGGRRVQPPPKSVDLRWHTAISERQPWDEVIRVAFSTLLDYSLIQWSYENERYNMHQLAHSWTFDRLSESEAHLFGTAMLLMHRDKGLTSMRTCLDRLTSIPNASSSDRAITLERFGTLGAYHTVTELTMEEEVPMRKELWIKFEHERLTMFQEREEEEERLDELFIVREST
jgi:hypothetical protein